MKNENNKILVVDDEPSIQRLIKSALEKVSFSIETHEDGFAALEFFQNNPVDLVLTDIKMPGISGIELATKIREICIETKKNIPFVFMSGTPEELPDTIGEEAARKEIFLAKPFDIKLLRETVGNILRPNGRGVPTRE